MVVPEPVFGPGQGWQSLGNGNMAAKMFRFIQRDIDEGRIWYEHTGSVKPEMVTFEVMKNKIRTSS